MGNQEVISQEDIKRVEDLLRLKKSSYYKISDEEELKLINDKFDSTVSLFKQLIKEDGLDSSTKVKQEYESLIRMYLEVEIKNMSNKSLAKEINKLSNKSDLDIIDQLALEMMVKEFNSRIHLKDDKKVVKKEILERKDIERFQELLKKKKDLKDIASDEQELEKINNKFNNTVELLNHLEKENGSLSKEEKEYVELIQKYIEIQVKMSMSNNMLIEQISRISSIRHLNMLKKITLTIMKKELERRVQLYSKEEKIELLTEEDITKYYELLTLKMNLSYTEQDKKKMKEIEKKYLNTVKYYQSLKSQEEIIEDEYIKKNENLIKKYLEIQIRLTLNNKDLVYKLKEYTDSNELSLIDKITFEIMKDEVNRRLFLPKEENNKTRK